MTAKGEPRESEGCSEALAARRAGPASAGRSGPRRSTRTSTAPYEQRSVSLVKPSRAPDLAPQRERSLELDSDLRPRLHALARLQHHAPDAVAAEPRMPEAGVAHFVSGTRGSSASDRK